MRKIFRAHKEIKFIQYTACAETRSWEVFIIYIFFPIVVLSSGNNSLFFSVSFSYYEQLHLPVFQKTISTLLRLLHEQESKNIQNCNIFICLGIEKMSWETQLKTLFPSFDVNLCATLHEFSRGFGIHNQAVFRLFASRIFKID